MKVTLVEESGSHLLLARGDRFVIVERRNNRIYNCYDCKRNGIAADDLSAIHQIIDETDWVDELTGRAAFNEVVSRRTKLEEGMR
jgi:hypothetical protein